MRTNKVFVAGGMPDVTYVDRAARNLERDLKAEIAEGHKVICVTGPTKSGKTVLTRHILGASKSATVNGGQVESSEEFWTLLLGALELPESESHDGGKEVAAGVKWIAFAQAKAAEGGSQTFNNNNKKTILAFMRDNDVTLVVDDFHYISDAIQREIIRSLKSEVFEGLVSILIAVPHRAFDAIGVEREMEGRFSHVQIPSWGPDELAAIANLGFPELNVDVPPACVNDFCKEAQGSPLLMQRFCLRLCINYEVEETLQSKKEINPSDRIRRDIYKSVAAQFGLPTFQKLSKGPQSRSKRIDRETIDSEGTLDIYQAVLRAVALTGPKEKLHYDDIRESLKAVLKEGSMPQKHEVSSALGHMSGIARDDIEGEPVLEWADDYLYLTDPFLMFYMRWSQRGEQPQQA